MQIHLDFKNPAVISSSGLDEIRISFEDTSLLFDIYGTELSIDKDIRRKVPPQFFSKTESAIFNGIQSKV